MPESFLARALLAGSLAAALDIVYAVLWLAPARTPMWVLQSVASGWLGKEAFTGGLPAAALGLASHFAICIAAAGIFGSAASRVAMLRSRWVLCGALFGVGVYLVMNFVVLPLSAFPFRLSYPPQVLAQGFVSHALLVGIPVAWVFRARIDPPPGPLPLARPKQLGTAGEGENP
jgi:hypothetical protein